MRLMSDRMKAVLALLAAGLLPGPGGASAAEAAPQSTDDLWAPALTAAAPVEEVNGAAVTLEIRRTGTWASARNLAATREAPPRVEAILRSVLAGLSTSLGAGIVLLLRGAPTHAQMAFALALAGGVMITVSLLEMWLPQLVRPERRLDCIVGAGIGMLGFLALKRAVPEPQLAPHPKACEDLEGALDAGDSPSHQHKVRQWRLAVLLTVALTAHNFPEGLAVAVSSLQSERLGFVVMAAIAVHNIPEGIAIAMPVLDATGSRTRAMVMATLSGLAEPLGAVLAVTALPEWAIKGRGMDALLSCIGGIMSCVALTELLPEALAQREWFYALVGALAGMGIMFLTHELA